MLCALLLSLATAPQPLDVVLEARTSARIELLARVGESRFLAVNPSERPQLLVFGDPLGTVRAGVLLPPGGEYESRFPAHVLEGLALEVVSFGLHGITSTGAFSLPMLRDGHYEAILVETTPRGSLAWGQGRAGVQLLEASGSLSGMKSMGATAAALKPAHVPVITPAGKKTGDRPPRMEKKPLPPM